MFADIDSLIQLQMVRDRFIDGQTECALRRHLDSFGPNTPMQTIVDSCHVWESHNEAGVRRHDGSGRNSPRAVYQVTKDSQPPIGLTESEMLDEVIRRLLPPPTVPPAKVAPIPSDCEMLIQRLLEVIRPPQLVIQERSQLTDMEIALPKLLPVSSVVEEEGPSSEFCLWRDVFLVEIGTMRRSDVRSWTSHFHSCRWDGRRTGLVMTFF